MFLKGKARRKKDHTNQNSHQERDNFSIYYFYVVNDESHGLEGGHFSPVPVAKTDLGIYYYSGD